MWSRSAVVTAMMAGVSSRLRAIAQDTVAIADRGSYRNPAGVEVCIGDDVARAVAATRLYLPDDPVPTPRPRGAVQVSVTNESSLAATRRLGGDVACLVFASARNPGGGFLHRIRRQVRSVAFRRITRSRRKAGQVRRPLISRCRWRPGRRAADGRA